MEKKPMNLTIKETLPIKYNLNMHLTDSLLTKESVAFELCKYVISEVESNDKKELVLDNLKFSSKTLKYIFGKRLSEDSQFKEHVVLSIKKLITDEYLKTDGKTIKFTEKIINEFYNID